MKKFSLILLSGFVLYACGNGNANEADQEATAAQEGHQHTYACPMHPEVTGKEGDTCPKCGMKLEHNDAAGNAGTYFMELTPKPATIQPNQEVTLSLVPKLKGQESEQVALDVEHEKKIHLILVSDDLSWFDHIHPQYTASGTYDVTARFPAPGTYKAFADYKPTGANHVVDKIDLKVEGAAPAAKTYSGEKLSGTSGAYSFELKPTGGKFITGTPLHIDGIVKKNGTVIDANTLDNYLGAKAHFVLISLNEKEYLHVHPEVTAGKFDLHTTIEKPGTYRGWVQFNADGRIQTIDFILNVTRGTEEDARKAAEAHGKGGQDDHSGH